MLGGVINFSLGSDYPRPLLFFGSLLIGLSFFLAVLVKITMVSLTVSSLRKKRGARDRLKMIFDSHFSQAVLRPLLTGALLDFVLCCLVDFSAYFSLFCHESTVLIHSCKFSCFLTLSLFLWCTDGLGKLYESFVLNQTVAFRQNMYTKSVIASIRHRPVDLYSAGTSPVQQFLWCVLPCHELGSLCGSLLLFCTPLSNEWWEIQRGYSVQFIVMFPTMKVLQLPVVAFLVLQWYQSWSWVLGIVVRGVKKYIFGPCAFDFVCSLSLAAKMGSNLQAAWETRGLASYPGFILTNFRYDYFPASSMLGTFDDLLVRQFFVLLFWWQQYFLV